jgi:hypothetical protein
MVSSKPGRSRQRDALVIFCYQSFRFNPLRQQFEKALFIGPYRMRAAIWCGLKCQPTLSLYRLLLNQIRGISFFAKIVDFILIIETRYDSPVEILNENYNIISTLFVMLYRNYADDLFDAF